MLDLGLREQRVVERQDRAAGIAEDDLDPEVGQRADDHARAVGVVAAGHRAHSLLASAVLRTENYVVNQYFAIRLRGNHRRRAAGGAPRRRRDRSRRRTSPTTPARAPRRSCVSAVVSLALPMNVPRWTSPPWLKFATATEPSIGVELLTVASGASRPPLNCRLSVMFVAVAEVPQDVGVVRRVVRVGVEGEARRARQAGDVDDRRQIAAADHRRNVVGEVGRARELRRRDVDDREALAAVARDELVGVLVGGEIRARVVGDGQAVERGRQRGQVGGQRSRSPRRCSR